MPTTTARLGLTQIVGTDTVASYANSNVQAGDMAILDSAMQIFKSSFAGRGGAGAYPYGTHFWATDTGDLSWSDGTNWHSLCQVPASSVFQPTTVNATISGTVSNGQTVFASGGTTQTLPSPTANAIVTIIAGTGASGASQVTVAGNPIYGLGLANPATSLALGAVGAYVTLTSDGTHWYVADGQQDTGWVTLSLGSGWSAGSGYAPAYRLIGDTVRFSGVASAGAGAGYTATATLPASIRPTTTAYPNCGYRASGGTFYATMLQITSGGATTFYSPPAVSTGDTAYFDAVIYRLM